MWPAFLAIAASLLLVLLGVIVSAHQEFTNRHIKEIYVAYGTLAIIAVWATLWQTRDNEYANRAVSVSLAKLDNATKEVARLMGLNTSLQQKLLDQSGTIHSLTEDSLKNITGGDSYPKISLHPARVGEPILLALSDEGKYMLTGVTVTVADVSDPQNMQEFTVGGIHPGWPRMLPFTLSPKLGKGGTTTYDFYIYTQTALFSEVLQIRAGKDGLWAYSRVGYKDLFDDEARAYIRKHFANNKDMTKSLNAPHLSISVPLFSDGWSDQPPVAPPKKP